MFHRNAQRLMTKVAAGVMSMAAALPAQGSLVCSWNLDTHPDRSPVLAYIARTLHQCDLIALQGVGSTTQPDALQMLLSHMGGDWAQLPPQAGAPDKAFLFNQEVVSYAGRRNVYDGVGTGFSARFLPVDSEPFVLASISAREKAESPYDLSSFLGHLDAAFPEDGRNWVIVGQMGTSANDEALASFRRSAKPLVHSIDTALPSIALETYADGLRVMARTERPGEAQDQVWVPIGSKVDVREAGAIDFLAAVEATGIQRPTLDEARAQISPYLPVYVKIGSGERMRLGKPPVLIPTLRSMDAQGQISKAY